jgi:hypothetical protein
MPKYEQGAKQGSRSYISRLRQTSKLMRWLLHHSFRRARIRLSLARIGVLLCGPLRVHCPVVSEIDGVPQSDWILRYMQDTESLLGEKKWIDPLDLDAWQGGWVSGMKWALRNTSLGTVPATQTKDSS